MNAWHRLGSLWNASLLALVTTLVILLPAPSLWAADTTPPTAPAQPREGMFVGGVGVLDYDYDGDGAYIVGWSAATDVESGIVAYELQERAGSGSWVTLSNTLTNTLFDVQGRTHGTRYSYQVRAKNGAGLWGSWSAASDGILVDTTLPNAVTVTDDGNYTNATDRLHATWTSTSDPESGIADYQYLIRKDSATTGAIIVPQTSAGLATQMTRTGLSLTNGTSYFIGVTASNGAGNFSTMNYSNGIVVDTVAPTVVISGPANGATVSGITVDVTATVTENNSMGTVQFKLDGANLGAPDATSPYKINWDSTAASNGTHTLTAVATDSAGNTGPISPAVTVTVSNGPSDTTPPGGSVTINGGAAGTNTTAATLTLSATDNSGSVAQMQFSNDGAAYSAAEAYATSKAWTLASGDGTKTVYAKFKDAAGNWSSAASDTITLDTTAPTISSVASSGITSSGATITWTTNEAATSQVDYGTTTSYGQSSALDLAPVTGHSVTLSGLSAGATYHYRARSKDGVGNERLGTDVTFVTAAPPDTTAPSGSITINGGASGTNTTAVTLALSATDNSGTVAQMQFSNDGASYSTAEAYATSKAWTLAGGDGTKTVYAKFKDAAGNWSAAASDTIVLDATAPTTSLVASSGVTSSGATITWTTNEASTSQADYGTTSSYGQSTALNASLVTSHSVGLSGLSASTTYHYRARSKDAAGNERLGADATFTTIAAADTTPPSGTITINAGAAATNNTAVTLTLAATDNAGTVAQMQFSNDGTTYSAAEAYATSKVWTLTAGDGVKTVSVKFKDAAGNWSAAASDTITLDTTPPTLQFTSPKDGDVIIAPSP